MSDLSGRAREAQLPREHDDRDHDGHHDRDHDGHHHGHGDHGHSHGLIHDSIKRSREGVRAVLISLGVLGLAAVAQTAVFVLSGSVALLGDLIHNFGDALTAVPLGIAFLMRSEEAERTAGLFVVAAIFISGCVAGVEAIQRLIHQVPPTHAAADAYVSLAVIVSAIVVALGAHIADPLIGLAITMVILRITWQSWHTVRGHDPSPPLRAS